MKRHDVLIVGAGPTGLALAEELTRFGARYRIVDTGRGPTDLSKAIGVQARTLEMLDIAGLADDLVGRGNRSRAFHLYDGDLPILRLDFTELASRFPFLLIVPQSDTEQTLIRKIESAGQTIERETTLAAFSQDPDGVDCTLTHHDGTTETVRVRWLAGCDGAHSTVRHTLGMAFTGEEYAEGFMLADVHVEWDLPRDELYLFLHDGWLTAFFPMPGGHCRMIADLPPDQAPPDRTPSLEECQRLVDERSPFRIVLSDPCWTAFYRIHRRIVAQLRQGRVLVAGDAAHIHSPAAAQGMNTGIQDAFNLGWKLALVTQGHAPETLIDSYQSERYPVEQTVLRDTDILLRAVSLRPRIARKLRDVMLPLVSSLPAFQHRISARIGELSIDYRRSPIVLDRGGSAGPHAGERAPDGTLRRGSAESAPGGSGGPAERGSGDEVRLYELLRVGRFLALAFAGAEGPIDADLIRGIAGALEPIGPIIQGYLVTQEPPTDSAAPDGWSALHDPAGAFHKAFGIDRSCVYLIRPDGYIAFRTDALSFASAFAEFRPRLFV